MTESEFLALEPRERDALVAEKAMGWKPLPDHADGLRPSYERYRKTHMDTPDDYPVATVREFPWYTQNIAAAWQVVEKMRETKREFVFYTDYESSRGDVWGAWFEFDSEEDGEVWDRAVWGGTLNESAPLAICIAALHAVGELE